MKDREPTIKWETIKERVKKVSNRFARENASQTKLAVGILAEKVNYYESNLPLNREDNNMLKDTKVDLDNLLMERAKGLLFRSKVRWHEEGEKNTTYFFSLEKMRYNAKTCYRMLDEQNVEILDPKQILGLQREFYNKLYQEDEHVSFCMENKWGIKVPQNIKNHQEEQITEKTILKL